MFSAYIGSVFSLSCIHLMVMIVHQEVGLVSTGSSTDILGVIGAPGVQDMRVSRLGCGLCQPSQ